MFDKIKQGKDAVGLALKAKQIQKKLALIEHSEEAGNSRVKVNGAQKIVYMEVDGAPRKDLVDLINKAMENGQKKVAQENPEELMKMLFGK